MKKLDLENVQEVSEFNKLPHGGYVCKITEVEDYPKGEYLEIKFDVFEGEHKGFFGKLFDQHNFWGGTFRKYYRDSSLRFFKSFITAVEKSNETYKWDNDETKLKGRIVGLTIGEREYMGNDGKVKTAYDVDWVHSVDRIKSGDFKMPTLKKLSGSEEFTEVETKDEDLPF